MKRIPDLLFVIGAVGVAYGSFLISDAAALIVGGSMFIAAGLAVARGQAMQGGQK